MLGWIIGLTKEDKIRYEYKKGGKGVPLIGKMRLNRLKWLRFILKRKDIQTVWLIKRMYNMGKKEGDDRKRGGVNKRV